jgi:hypothetical protein
VVRLWRRQARRGVGRGGDGEPTWPAGVAAAPSLGDRGPNENKPAA